jgi:hypothetical protein
MMPWVLQLNAVTLRLKFPTSPILGDAIAAGVLPEADLKMRIWFIWEEISESADEQGK